MTIGAAVRAVTRPLRRALRALATSDPDGSQLRLAATTILTMTVIATVMVFSAGFAGLPAAALSPGLIVGMIASTTVRDKDSVTRAVTIAMLVPAALVSVSLAATLSGLPLASNAVFVAVAAGAVCVRVFGPRGTSVGLVAFMSYFVALVTGTATTELSVVAAALLVSAGLVVIIKQVFGRPQPAHDLQRMLIALGDRAYRVVEPLSDGVTESGLDEQLRRTVRSRLAASRSTASAVEGRLENAPGIVVPGITEGELGARVFDFQLSLESLVVCVRQLLSPANPNPPATVDRIALAKKLRTLGVAVRGPVRLDRPDPAPIDHPGLHCPGAPTEGPMAHLDRTLAVAIEAWHRVASRGPDAPEAPTAATAESEGTMLTKQEAESGRTADSPEHRRTQMRTFSRQAVQVAVAAALAIAAGTAISSSYWYWAVIATFIIYVGTSSRGEILSKGWLRIVGTVGGVAFGIVVASLVGKNVVLAMILIAACLFLSVYLTPISSAFTIFFITTLLALLYGLLGVLSFGLLLTRLSETAAGAAIGVGVAYVVLPISTRAVARDRMRDFLGSLAAALTSATTRLGPHHMGPELTDERTPRPTASKILLTSVQDLRNTFEELDTAVKPLTRGAAGLPDRSGSRRTMQLVCACERHGRALLRLADHSPEVVHCESLGKLLDQASQAVCANVETMSGAVGSQYHDVTMTSATSLLDAFDDQIDGLTSGRTVLVSVSRSLRAIDRAICTRAEELGASVRAGDVA